jgi:hypothetical protein
MPGPLSQHRSRDKVFLVLHFLEAKIKFSVAKYLASMGCCEWRGERRMESVSKPQRENFVLGYRAYLQILQGEVKGVPSAYLVMVLSCTLLILFS